MIKIGMGILVVLPIGFAAACQRNRALLDQRPHHIAKEQIQSTVWVAPAHRTGENSFNYTNYGSAVIITSRALVTNAHVWVGSNSDIERESERESIYDNGQWEVVGESGRDAHWWNFELPQRGELAIAYSHESVESKSETESPPIRILHMGLHDCSLAASGKNDVIEHSADWVLLVTDEPAWPSSHAAHIHPPALDPEWRVPEGSELFQAGFGSDFRHDQYTQDPESRNTFIKNGPYVIRGKAIDTPSWAYSLEDKETQGYITRDTESRLGGHSGGGVYIWNAEACRPELVGINVSSSFKATNWLGFQFTDEMTSNYIPISAIAHGVQTVAEETQQDEEQDN